MKKKQTEKNYRSRYDRNRMCYRKDKTTYVYSEYVDDGNGQGHYIDHEYHVGDMDETGSVITFEMLDMLQDFDNDEAQDTEDQERNEEVLVHNTFSDGDFTEVGMACIASSPVKGTNGLSVSGAVKFGSELVGPESVLFGEDVENISVQEFREKILPLLTEEQINLIYDRFGSGKTLEQIGAEQDKPVSKQAIDKRLKGIFKKIAENMSL